VADAADYQRLATRLIQGRGYVNSAGVSTAWRPPAYPLFLAGLFRLVGTSVLRTTLAQALLGGLTVLALIALGAMMIGWQRALLAGVIAAIYPLLIWLPRLLLSENLSLFFLLLSLCTAVLYFRTSRVIWIIVFGVLCALSSLVRGANLVLPVAVAAGLLITRFRNWKELIAPLAVMAVMFTLTLVPWTIRNYRAFHEFIPIATQDGLTLYGSYWPPQQNGKRIWGSLPGDEDPAIVAAAQTGNEVSASRYLQRVTLERLRENPSFFFSLIPSKLASLLVPLDWEVFPHAPGTTRSLNIGYLLILLPALLGFVIMIRERVRYQWLLWSVLAIVLLQSILIYGSPRFRLPAELIAILPASVGVWSAGEFIKRRLRL
jgi:4-amino-4-deoxy-L-arabinose transferase-like glycosyltransferase